MGIVRGVRAHGHALAWNSAAFAFLALVAREAIGKTEPNAPFATVLITAAGMCGLFGNAHRFEMFKLFGLEARTRAVVQEAEAVTAMLRDLAAAMGAVMVYSVSSAGRLGGKGSAALEDEQKDEILKILSSTGVSSQQIAAAAKADRPFVLVDYANGILRRLEAVSSVAHADIQVMYSQWNESDVPPTSSELRDFCSRHQNVPADITALIDDLQHYEQTSTHRRPDVWAARGHWGD